MNTIQPSVLPFYNKDHLSPLPDNMFLVFTQDLIRMTFTNRTSTKILPRVVCPRCACSLSLLFCESSLELPRAARQLFQPYSVPCESHFPIFRLLLQQYPFLCTNYCLTLRLLLQNTTVEEAQQQTRFQTVQELKNSQTILR